MYIRYHEVRSPVPVTCHKCGKKTREIYWGKEIHKPIPYCPECLGKLEDNRYETE